MKAQDFEANQPPWFDIGKWRRWAESKGITIIEGDRHNRTDGEVHYILEHGTDTLDLHTNYWDWRSGWDDAIVWIETTTHNKGINKDA